MGSWFMYEGGIAFHPGCYIEEIVEDGGFSRQGFADRLGVAPETLDRLIDGRQDVDAETAEKLSKALGTSVEYWLNLQCAYDEALLRKEGRNGQ